VRNGGKYDGRLGILVPMACVRELHRAGKRLPFGIEVVGFAEEEGQRYRATFLGSGALIGHFNPAWLEQTDADGVTMRQAMHQAGLPGTMEAIANLQRDASRYLGFVEVHIEQGPVLNEMDLPLGVVTSINGSVRCLVEIQGMASHAGTTPMNRRRDAAAAAAEVILYVERRAASVPDVVGTVGQLEVPSGSINVVPGRCRFSLDLRATTNAARDASRRVLQEVADAGDVVALVARTGRHEEADARRDRRVGRLRDHVEAVGEPFMQEGHAAPPGARGRATRPSDRWAGGPPARPRSRPRRAGRTAPVPPQASAGWRGDTTAGRSRRPVRHSTPAA
jgi:hydantoinase/carbamoylase family amidase